MERRLTIIYSASAAATICTACVAIGAVFGSPFAQARPAVHSAIERVETVDDYVVMPSPTTTATTTATTTPVIDHASFAAQVAVPAPADTTPATTTVAAARAADTSIPAPATSSPTQQPSSPATTPADPTSDDQYGSHERHHSDGADHSDDGEHEEGDD